MFELCEVYMMYEVYEVYDLFEVYKIYELFEVYEVYDRYEVYKIYELFQVYEINLRELSQSQERLKLSQEKLHLFSSLNFGFGGWEGGKNLDFF